MFLSSDMREYVYKGFSHSRNFVDFASKFYLNAISCHSDLERTKLRRFTLQCDHLLLLLFTPCTLFAVTIITVTLSRRRGEKWNKTSRNDATYSFDNVADTSPFSDADFTRNLLYLSIKFKLYGWHQSQLLLSIRLMILGLTPVFTCNIRFLTPSPKLNFSISTVGILHLVNVFGLDEDVILRGFSTSPVYRHWKAHKLPTEWNATRTFP